ncbi:MAG: FtsX-like permease family protein [Salinivirgaceae bacterium]
MILRNLNFAWKNIRKDGTYSIINIAGLALGLTVVVFILFWVADELNFDKFHKNLNRIYTVFEHQLYSEGQELYTSCTPFPLGKELVKKFPEVAMATTFNNLWTFPINYENIEYNEGPVFSVDSNFLSVFSYTLISGNKNALAAGEIIITDELGRLFFGNESPLGKTLKFNNEFSFSVGAVIAAPKSNSTLNFKVLIPIEFLQSNGANLNAWGNNWPNTTILLKEGTNAESLDAKIANVCKDNGQENTSLHLFPYKNEHLYSYSGKNNRIQYIYQFLGIALIIILIASINFINLSISRAEQRRQEIGVRKVMGANRTNILKQFLLEKGMMIFFSILLCWLMVVLFLPLFRSLSEKNIQFGQIQNPYILLMMLGVIFTVLGLSVVYPSMYLSSVNAIVAIRKQDNKKQRMVSLKSLLVIFQFALAIILISGSIIISQQIKYVNNYDIGYNHANLIYLQLDGNAKSKHEAIKQKLTTLTGVESITRSDKLPFWGGNSSWGHDWEGKDPDNRVLICKMNADKNYFKTLGINFIDGNDFPDSYENVLNPDDFKFPQVILNQEAIRRMGIDNPVGKYFSPWSGDKGVIIGVVEDFHYESLHNGVEPLFILPLLADPEYIIIRVSSSNFSKTIAEIKNSWLEVIPQSKCEVGFFDNRLAEYYNGEVKISGLFKYFTFVAIFISCIGLFGLSLFVIERRRKEVGIRKVNGASILEVILMLNQSFISWVIVALVIATPIAFIAMNRWLQNFAYKTPLSWWIFTLAGIIALGIAIVTVSWQSWKAATRNPVEALRYE